MTLPAPDWRQPWFASLRDTALAVQARLDAGATLPDALNLPGAPRRFVDAAELPPGMAYEAFVAATGRVPTRPTLHDLFNGLVWHAEPALKSRLNALHAAAIARDGVGPRRGALRDALTHFDEFGALLQAPPPLLAALRERRWRSLFVEQRGLWAAARLTVVGHALLEQLAVAPRKALTAHVFAGSAEQALALDEAGWSARPLHPLPLLGVPGWWPGNADPAFYTDAAVFRPAPAGGIGRRGLNRHPPP